MAIESTELLYPVGLFTQGEFQIEQSKIVADITKSTSVYAQQLFTPRNVPTNRLLHIPTRAVIEDRPDGHPGINVIYAAPSQIYILLMKTWNGQVQHKKTLLSALGIVSTSAYLAHPKNGTACSLQPLNKYCAGSICLKSIGLESKQHLNTGLQQ